MEYRKSVSVLIPCYNEEQSLLPLFESLTAFTATQSAYDWQFLFVNDGSTDGTLDVIRQLRQRDGRVCYVSLSRNFGKENAMLAGFDHVSGDCTVIMDADMQHPPVVIGDMLQKWEEGFQDVYAKRITRGKESFLRRNFTKCYYKILQKMSETEVLSNVGDFRLLDRKCINALKSLRETQRYTKGLYCWIGFRKTFVMFEQQARTEGKSSFNYAKLINLAIEGITSNSTTPLRIATVMGIVISFLAFVYMCFVLIRTLIIGEPVQGFPTLIITILFLGGLQLLSIGVIGEYLGRIFRETKNRPAYIVDEMEV